MNSRDLLQQALTAMEDAVVECHSLHHRTKDRHEYDEDCGPLERYDAVKEAIRAHLAKPERDDLVTISKKQLRAWLEDGRDNGRTDWRGENEV